MLVGINVAISWLIIILILFFTHPAQASWWVHFALYAVTFVAVGGTYFLAEFFARFKLKKNVVALREMRIAFRHGAFVGIGALISLGASAAHILQTWNFALLFVALVLINFLYSSSSN
jgi:hypothetical protein